jgi:hypothetical protein
LPRAGPNNFAGGLPAPDGGHTDGESPVGRVVPPKCHRLLRRSTDRGDADLSAIETTTFRLRPGADERSFIATDQRVQTEVFYRCDGLLRRTTGRNDAGEWLVIVLWRSATSADAAAERLKLSDGVGPLAELMAFVDDSTIDTRRYSTLD